MWILLGLFTLVAVVGKVGGTYIAARACGESPKDSIYLGAFMNTRGLMELVVLGVGYEMRILPPAIYAVLVLMTVITTVMTMPMVHFINWANKILERHHDRIEQLDKASGLKVLLSFGRPSSGVTLLRLTDQLLRRGEVHPHVTALHITTDQDINSIDADKYFADSFGPILAEAEQLAQPIETSYQISDKVESTILTKLVQERYNLLIVGAGVRFSSEADDQEAVSMREEMRRRVGAFSVHTTEALLSIHGMLRDKMQFFIDRAPCSVGILVSRSFETPREIVLYLARQEDLRMLPYARTMAQNNGTQLQLVVSEQLQHEGLTLHEGERIVSQQLQTLPEGCELAIISGELWQDTFERNKALLASLPSTLILNIK